MVSSKILSGLHGSHLAIGINTLTQEDCDALVSVLPPGLPVDSQYSFYLFAAELFRQTFVSHEVHFSQLAIQVAPSGTDTAPLWTAVVKGLIDLGLYEDAYASVMAIPFEKESVFFISLTPLLCLLYLRQKTGMCYSAGHPHV